MKNDILALARLARKRERHIIGLMSGTSLDGLDVAWCVFSGAGTRAKVRVEAFETVPYDEAFKAGIREVFARKNIDFQRLVLLNVAVAEHHARLVLQCLQRWGASPTDIDLLASHGQTVFHAPRILHGLPDEPNATLQIGDGDHLAVRTGITTVSDFRQKHCAVGGEGAPLALYGDYFLFSKTGQNRVLLNIGGIANFTFLPADGNPERAFATDTGPGNTLLDRCARTFFGAPFDRDGKFAAAGRVDEQLLVHFLSDPFFQMPMPKTTGPELFSKNWLERAFAQMPNGRPEPHDLMATLTELTVQGIAGALRKTFPDGTGFTAFASGGGAHNPLIMNALRRNFPAAKFAPMEKLGVHGDAKEAVLFACLANELVAGSAPDAARLGGLPLASMGKISLPR